jgi:hypothetical protein
MVSLGPGTLIFGPTATSIDASCLINNARIETDKEQDDARYKLCGTATPGKITYTYKLTGNLDTDVETNAGLFAYSQEHAGEQIEFEFVPNTAAATSAAGMLVIDPLDFGADEFGSPLDSDIEFTIIGKPVFTFPDDAS